MKEQMICPLLAADNSRRKAGKKPKCIGERCAMYREYEFPHSPTAKLEPSCCAFRIIADAMICADNRGAFLDLGLFDDEEVNDASKQ